MPRRSSNNKNEKTERNFTMLREYQEGTLLIDLAKRYGLSVPRVHRIIQQEENKYLREQNQKLRDQLLIQRRR